MSWRRDLDLLSGEEVDIVLRPHPFSFIRYHLFFVFLILLALPLKRLHILIGDNAHLLSDLSFLDAALSRLGMGLVDAVFLASFWAILLIIGWAGSRLLRRRLIMLFAVLILASATLMELYLSLVNLEITFIQRPYVKLVLLTAAAAAAMIVVEVHRGRCIYIVTNRRVIVRRGLTLKEEEIAYDEISNIRVEQGILGRLLKFGTVTLISRLDLGLREAPEALKRYGEEAKAVSLEEELRRLTLYGVPNPRKVRVIIGNRQLEAREP
jgi:membrane protein YdbS with pleckstrin-like domain